MYVNQCRKSQAAEYFQQKLAQGWKLVSVEWERPAEKPNVRTEAAPKPIPFGLQIADDCQHLKENINEKKALLIS